MLTFLWQQMHLQLCTCCVCASDFLGITIVDNLVKICPYKYVYTQLYNCMHTLYTQIF